MATTCQGPRKRAGEWDDGENGDDLQSPAKKKQPPVGSRFATPTGATDLEIASKPGPVPAAVPKNTEKNDQWAARALNEWISDRNQRCEEKCFVDLLHTEDAETLAKWLSLFTMEVRKKSGEKYPPTSIRMMLFALQRIMRRENKHPFNIFSPADERFRSFQNTMESTFQNLHSEGVGVVVKHTPCIEEKEEDVLWERGILGAHSPIALLRTVFYLNGINFGLRGGREHREMKLSQFVRADGHWKYIDNSLKDSRQKKEVVRQLQRVAGRSERCHFKLLDLYISKLSEQARAKDAFYFNPVPEVPFDPRMPWYTSVPLGRNKLDRLVKEMFTEAGIEGKTCQSLWVTASTRSSQQDVPQRRIEGQAEHHSAGGFIVHERLGDEQDEHSAGEDPLHGQQGQPGAMQTQPLIQHNQLGTEQDQLHISTQLDQLRAGTSLGAGQDRIHIGTQQLQPDARHQLGTGYNGCEQDRTACDVLTSVFRESVELPAEDSRSDQGPAQCSGEELSSGHFTMPFVFLRNGSDQQNVQEQCKKLKAHINELKHTIERMESTTPTQVEPEACSLACGDSLTGNQHELEMEQLENQLSDYRDGIGQHEDLLQRSTQQTQNPESMSLLQRERMQWKEQGRLEAHREALKEQREAFELEKKKHLEAVRRLDRERQIFEAEKAAFLRQHFHGGSPSNQPVYSRAKPGCSTRPTEG